MLLWQPQKGKKQGVRWYDFGGSKKQAEAGISGLKMSKVPKRHSKCPKTKDARRTLFGQYCKAQL